MSLGYPLKAASLLCLYLGISGFVMDPSDAWLELVISNANDYGHIIIVKPKAVGWPCWVVLCLYCWMCHLANTVMWLPQPLATMRFLSPIPMPMKPTHPDYHTKLIFCTGFHLLPSFRLTSPDLANVISHLILCDAFHIGQICLSSSLLLIYLFLRIWHFCV